jgi:hypothetical protein
MKVHHFVNLVSLRYHVENQCESNVYYVDSISLSVVLKLMRIQHSRRSGVGFYSNETFDDAFYFLAYDSGVHENYTVVPWLEESAIERYASEFIDNNDIQHFKSVVIGISSPKQDILGRCLTQVFTGEIYCLGAAIQYRDSMLVDFSDIVGLTWLLMFLRSPYRTMNKIVKTITQLIPIVVSKNYRKEINKMNFQNQKYEL